MIDITIGRTLVINILVHIFILFIFLYLFFFFFIAKIEESTLTSQVDNMADNKMPLILQEIDNLDFIDKKIEILKANLGDNTYTYILKNLGSKSTDKTLVQQLLLNMNPNIPSQNMNTIIGNLDKVDWTKIQNNRNFNKDMTILNNDANNELMGNMDNTENMDSIFMYIFKNMGKQSIDKDKVRTLLVDMNVEADKISYILSMLDEFDNVNWETVKTNILDTKFIDWDKIKKRAEEELLNDDAEINDFIETNNANLKYIGMIIIISLFILIITCYVYYTYVEKKSVNIMHVLKENLSVFIIIGAIEFIFFKTTAIKYVPVFPSEIGKTMFDKIKDNIIDI